MTHDAWRPDAHCRHCGRKVAEASAHVDGAQRIGAQAARPNRCLHRWANNGDRYMATRPAREGFYAKFEREVDPEGKLTPQERAKRVEWAMKAHMQRMALKSAKARRRNQ
jgi:hypothetical protein